MGKLFDGFSDKIKEIIIIGACAIILILVTAALTGSASVRSINDTIDMRIDSRIETKLNDSALPMLREIKTNIDFLVESYNSDYIVKIDKQVEKIRKDPSDIKMVDIQDVLQKWKTYPEARKTDDIIAKYTVIKDWYAKNQ